MGLKIAVNSTLGGGFLISLLALFAGKATKNVELADTALPFVWIFGVLWAAFVVLSLARNVRSFS